MLPSATGARDGFLFSVPEQVEGLGQVEGGVVQRQSMDGRPEVQHVPLDPAIGVEALKGVLPQMDGEGSLRVSGLAVHGARTTALVAAAGGFAVSRGLRGVRLRGLRGVRLGCFAVSDLVLCF
jgi:hypothetical protein